MKKILFFAMMLLCSTTVVGSDVVSVATLSELKRAIREDNGAHILLTADIDAEELDGTLCETFTGTIDGTDNSGRGHAISNASSTLFSRLNGATLKNIVISGFGINGAQEPIVMYEQMLPCHGIIACEATNGCKFENVLIEGCDLRSYCSVVGGIVGYSDGSTFVDSNIDNQSSIYSDVDILNMSYHGGLVGLSKNDTFTRCVNSALVAIADATYSHLGGIVGYIVNTRMESCINSGLIVAFREDSESFYTIYEKYKEGSLSYVAQHRGQDYIAQKLTDDMLDLLYYASYYGGISGFGTTSTFVDCVNISPCYYGYVEGGIAGYAEECSFDRCINYNSVYGRELSENISTERGGIVGTAGNPQISNCLNLGAFPGLKGTCGGIAQKTIGRNSTIRNCLSAAEGVPIYEFYGLVEPELSNNYRLGTKFSEGKSVTIVTAGMLASGLVTYMLNDAKNDPETNTWQQNMGDYPVPGNKGLYHTREVTSQYGTVCLPYALKSDNDIQYYTFTSVETGESSVTLHFEAAEEVGASCPALFSVKTTGTYSFDDAQKDYSFGTYNTDNTEWRLLGTFEQKEFSGTDAQGIYYLADVQFCNTSTVTIPPFTAYFHGPDTSTLEGKTISFVIGGDGDDDNPASAITLPMYPAPLVEGQGATSIMGTRVGNGYRGIVIQNGRKYVRR